MTCIVGLICKIPTMDGPRKRIWMGSDSMGSNGRCSLTIKNPKIFYIKDMLIGYTTSFRMGQLIECKLKLPKATKEEKDNPYKYMIGSFSDAVRKVLKDNGFSNINNNVETGGTFLVGYKGRLFEVQNDFSILELTTGYASVGCGQNYSLGSMYSSFEANKIQPREVVHVALQAAAEHCSLVKGPFHIGNDGKIKEYV